MREKSMSIFHSSRRGLTAAIIGSVLILVACVFSIAAQTSVVAQPKSDPLKDLKYRLIGPFRGGRVGAVEGVADKPNVYFFGAT